MENQFTVQGRDTPISRNTAGLDKEGWSGGGRCDRKKSLPDVDQDEEPLPWRSMPKKNIMSLTTSPPWSNKQPTAETPTLNKSICIDLCWDEDEGKSIKKRKLSELGEHRGNNAEAENYLSTAQETSARNAKWKSLKKLIKSMDEVTRELSKLITNNTNTKREIKEAASKLRTKSSLMNTADMWEFINSIRAGDVLSTKETEVPGYNIDCNTQTEDTNNQPYRPSVETRTQETQTDSAETTDEIRERDKILGIVGDENVSLDKLQTIMEAN